MAFGEVIHYGSHLCWGSGRDSAPDEATLVLYDKSEFWLVEIVRGYVFRVTTCGWTVGGSRTLLSAFLFSSPEWMKLLLHATKLMLFWATVLPVVCFEFIETVRIAPIARPWLSSWCYLATKRPISWIWTTNDSHCQENVMEVEDDRFPYPEIGGVLLRPVSVKRLSPVSTSAPLPLWLRSMRTRL